MTRVSLSLMWLVYPEMSLVEADLWEIPVREREDEGGCSESHLFNLQRRAEDKRAILEGCKFSFPFLSNNTSWASIHHPDSCVSGKQITKNPKAQCTLATLRAVHPGWTSLPPWPLRPYLEQLPRSLSARFVEVFVNFTCHISPRWTSRSRRTGNSTRWFALEDLFLIF